MFFTFGSAGYTVSINLTHVHRVEIREETYTFERADDTREEVTGMNVTFYYDATHEGLSYSPSPADIERLRKALGWVRPAKKPRR